MSNPYKFRAYRNAALNSVAGGMIVIFDATNFDTGSNYSTSTGKFTAPISGFYHFETAIQSNANTTGWQVQLYVNGAYAAVGTLVSGAASGASTSVALTQLQLNANDYVQVELYSGSAIAILNTSGGCFFGGHLVSES